MWKQVGGPDGRLRMEDETWNPINSRRGESNRAKVTGDVARCPLRRWLLRLWWMPNGVNETGGADRIIVVVRSLGDCGAAL
jgi:hypothetical protein